MTTKTFLLLAFLTLGGCSCGGPDDDLRDHYEDPPTPSTSSETIRQAPRLPSSWRPKEQQLQDPQEPQSKPGADADAGTTTFDPEGGIDIPSHQKTLQP